MPEMTPERIDNIRKTYKTEGIDCRDMDAILDELEEARRERDGLFAAQELQQQRAEAAEQRVKDLESLLGADSVMVDKAQNAMADAWRERDTLQQRIKKAVGLIEKFWAGPTCRRVISILKGESDG